MTSTGRLTLASLLTLAAHAGPLPTPPALPSIPTRTLVVTDYGAVGDGTSTNTAAIQEAIAAASAAGGGAVVVPKGIFLSGPIRLSDRVALWVEGGAILRMLPLDKYPGGTIDPENFISGASLQDVAITGPGMIDGQGTP